MGKMQIGARPVGPGEPVYVIAEMSANHGQSFEQAVAIVQAAKSAGADAIKLQTYTPDTMTIASSRPEFRIEGTIWNGRNLYELYGEAYTPWEWQPRLKEAANDLGLELFSTPFDATAVDFLEEMNVPAHKLASFELVDIPLIQKMARTGKPLIMSTGMATLEEIEEAVETARSAGAEQIALLKCTSAYPAAAEEMNLRTIPELARRFERACGTLRSQHGFCGSGCGGGLGSVHPRETHYALARRARAGQRFFPGAGGIQSDGGCGAHRREGAWASSFWFKRERRKQQSISALALCGVRDEERRCFHQRKRALDSPELWVAHPAFAGDHRTPRCARHCEGNSAELGDG